MATWNIVQMDAAPTPETDVVITVHWELTAVDGDYNGRVYGSVGIERDEDATLIPYADLTKDQVVGWVKAALGEETVAAHEANVAQQIADQANPPVVAPALPW